MSMHKTIFLHQSIYDLCTEFPELKEFMKGIELDQLVDKLRALGFKVES